MKFITYPLILSLVFVYMGKLSKKQTDSAKRYLSFANLAYCNFSDIKSMKCAPCKDITKLGHKIEYIFQTRKTKYGKTVILQVLITKSSTETVISFSGPKSENLMFIHSLYKKGLAPVPKLGDLFIEEEYWKAYMYMREKMIKGINRLKTKGMGKVVFTGHSFGASIATIAAYDVAYNKIIEKSQTNGPFLYSYSPLKIGTDGFLVQVQKFLGVPVVRIKKKYDYYTLIPYCIYEEKEKSFRCFPKQEELVKMYPVYQSYFTTKNAAKDKINEKNDNSAKNQTYSRSLGNEAKNKNNSKIEKNDTETTQSQSKSPSKTKNKNKNNSKIEKNDTETTQSQSKSSSKKKQDSRSIDNESKNNSKIEKNDTSSSDKAQSQSKSSNESLPLPNSQNNSTINDNQGSAKNNSSISEGNKESHNKTKQSQIKDIPPNIKIHTNPTSQGKPGYGLTLQANIGGHTVLKGSLHYSDKEKGSGGSNITTIASFVQRKLRVQSLSSAERKIQSLARDGKNCVSSGKYVSCKNNHVYHETLWGINIERCGK